MPSAMTANRTRLSWILWALLHSLGQKSRFLVRSADLSMGGPLASGRDLGADLPLETH